jgi:hypothetical protein
MLFTNASTLTYSAWDLAITIVVSVIEWFSPLINIMGWKGYLSMSVTSTLVRPSLRDAQMSD